MQRIYICLKENVLAESADHANMKENICNCLHCNKIQLQST